MVFRALLVMAVYHISYTSQTEPFFSHGAGGRRTKRQRLRPGETPQSTPRRGNRQSRRMHQGLTASGVTAGGTQRWREHFDVYLCMDIYTHIYICLFRYRYIAAFCTYIDFVVVAPPHSKEWGSVRSGTARPFSSSAQSAVVHWSPWSPLLSGGAANAVLLPSSPSASALQPASPNQAPSPLISSGPGCLRYASRAPSPVYLASDMVTVRPSLKLPHNLSTRKQPRTADSCGRRRCVILTLMGICGVVLGGIPTKCKSFVVFDCVVRPTSAASSPAPFTSFNP